MAASAHKTSVRLAVVLTALLVTSARAESWIIGEGLENKATGEKIHLAASDYSNENQPRYVQFFYTSAKGETEAIGPNLPVHGDLKTFIQGFAREEGLIRDPHRSRKFYLTSIFFRQTKPSNLPEWRGGEGAAVLGGMIGAYALATRPLLKALKYSDSFPSGQRDLRAVGILAAIVVSFPIVADLIAYPFMAIFDAFDFRLQYPFGKNLDRMPVTNRENWLLRTRKIKHTAFENFAGRIQAMPKEPVFERRTLDPSRDPRLCSTRSAHVFVDPRIEWGTSVSIYGPSDAQPLSSMTANDRRKNQVLNIAEYVESGRKTPKVTNESGGFELIASSAVLLEKKKICIEHRLDSVVAAQPLVFRRCAPNSRNGNKNFDTVKTLLIELNREIQNQDLSCENIYEKSSH